MSTPFPQTKRALRADDYRPTLIISIMAITLLTLTALWFFLSTITVYESSTQTIINDDNTLIVTFTTDQLRLIAIGQPAFIRIEDAFGDVKSIPAQVIETSIDIKAIESQRGRVLLVVVPPSSLADAVGVDVEVSISVDIVVDLIRPYALILRSSGLSS
jgi:hypothetical protein